MEGKKRVVPREVLPAEKPVVTTNGKKSAEVIVAEMRRTESIGVPSMTEKGGDDR